MYVLLFLWSLYIRYDKKNSTDNICSILIIVLSIHADTNKSEVTLKIRSIITSFVLVVVLTSMNTSMAVDMYTQADLDNITNSIIEVEKKQSTAHDMAENARELGLIESSETIIEAKRIWLECHTELQELKSKAEVIKKALESRVYMGEFRLTAYCPCIQCCGKTNGITASGAKAVEGVTVAADIRKLPMGTRVYIEGVGERVVQDVGGAIKNNKLDIFVSKHGAEFNAAYNQKAAKVWILK